MQARSILETPLSLHFPILPALLAGPDGQDFAVAGVGDDAAAEIAAARETGRVRVAQLHLRGSFRDWNLPQ